MAEKESPRHFTTELLEMLPPTARTILLWILVPPIGLSIAGMILQVNVGAMINNAVDVSMKRSRGETVEIVGDALAVRMNGLDARLNAMDTTIRGISDRLVLVERSQHRIQGELPRLTVPRGWK